MYPQRTSILRLFIHGRWYLPGDRIWDNSLSMNQQEIKRIEQVRTALVEQREQYLRRLQKPLNERNGKPLTKATLQAFRKQIARFDRLVAMHDRQINRLFAREPATGKRMKG